MIKIMNGDILGEDGVFRRGNISISEDVITDIDYNAVPDSDNEQPQVIDADGLYVVPGLVDIHLHGAVGHDFCEGTQEAFQKIVDFQLSNGITTIVPATMTLPQEELLKITKAIGGYAEKHTEVKGITLEGPFVSSEKRGAQNGLYIRKPDVELFRNLQETSGGFIKQVVVAPESDGAINFIKNTCGDCVVSVGHTTADYECTTEAFSAGADHVTHLFNAMTPFGHRESGVVGAAFDNKNVFVELICDGVHIHPSVVRTAFKMFGAERICMISDSMSATGMKDGEYRLGGQVVKRTGEKAVLADGTIAGAVSTLYDNLKNAVINMKIPLEEAVLSCTATPAKSLRIENECGIITTGRKADIVLLDEKLDIRYVIHNGKIL